MKPAARLALALATAVLLAACASRPTRPPASGGAPGPSATPPARPGDNIHLPQDERYHLERDSGPAQPPVDISKLPEPVPKVEPLSRYGNRSPYTVNGHTWRVLADPRGYAKRGLASWYGNKFNGYLTSSMERYDMYKFTAASKVLPLPSYARVTNLANGKSVIVRINDRGPFVPDRIIDLSYAAAVRIGIWPQGTGMVEVQAIDPAHPGELPPATAVGNSNAAPTGSVWLQVGSFADADNARRVADRLRAASIGPVQVSSVNVQGRAFTRVRVGPLPDAAAAEQVRGALERLGLTATPVTID